MQSVGEVRESGTGFVGGKVCKNKACGRVATPTIIFRGGTACCLPTARNCRKQNVNTHKQFVKVCIQQLIAESLLQLLARHTSQLPGARTLVGKVGWTSWFAGSQTFECVVAAVEAAECVSQTKG
jgi:hypothetical protein